MSFCLFHMTIYAYLHCGYYGSFIFLKKGDAILFLPFTEKLLYSHF
jgi:hypothetical protein